jgi:hypothetical protein
VHTTETVEAAVIAELCATRPGLFLFFLVFFVFFFHRRFVPTWRALVVRRWHAAQKRRLKGATLWGWGQQGKSVISPSRGKAERMVAGARRRHGALHT